VFHGTDLDSGLRFLNGMALDTAVAAARKIDGPPGFFLAVHAREAAFFAVRRMPGTVVQVILSADAVRQLQAAGMVRQPIPNGLASRFTGDELIVPPAAFDTFNCLRAVGEIQFLPARVP
jgi:hypothetical protein